MFPRQVASALGESGLDPDKLWLEITESTLMQTGDASAAALSALRALGAHLEIDDFGTGYSSLSYLKRLPVETLKVDQSFVDELDSDADDVAIVRAIVGLGDSLGLAIVAEGVERRSQARAHGPRLHDRPGLSVRLSPAGEHARALPRRRPEQLGSHGPDPHKRLRLVGAHLVRAPEHGHATVTGAPPDADHR